MQAPQVSAVAESTNHQMYPCAHLLNAAQRELTAFASAVAESHGAEQARLSAEDWLRELMSTNSLVRPATRGLRLVTIAASARLASRLTVRSN